MKTAGSSYGYAFLATIIVVVALYFFWPSAKRQDAAEVATVTPLLPNRPSETATKTEIGREIESPKQPTIENAAGRSTKTFEAAPVVTVKSKGPSPTVDVKQPEAQDKLASNTRLTTVTTGPLTLSLNIIGQRKEPDGSYSEIIIREGSVLRSHDNFQVHLVINRPAYVYVLIYDSQGKASQLFPDAKIGQGGVVQEGIKLVIPPNNLWFWLDENTGTETLYVLAAEKPMQDIQGLLARMDAADEDSKRRFSQEMKRKIVQRGLAVVATGPSATYTLSDGKKIQNVTDVVSGTGSVVRAVSFQHR